MLRLTCDGEVNRDSQIAPGLNYNGTVTKSQQQLFKQCLLFVHEKFWRNEAELFSPRNVMFSNSALFLNAVIAKGVLKKIRCGALKPS